MAVSAVRDDAAGMIVTGTPLGTTRAVYYLIAPAGKKFRVYESIADYSSTTGGFNRKGLVERNVDDLPVSFDTEADAEAWIKAGLPVDIEVQR